MPNLNPIPHLLTFRCGRFLPLALAASLLSIATQAQQPTVTAQDYARAEQFMSYNTQPLVDHVLGQINWLDNDRFWYRTLTAQGSEYVLADPARKARTVTATPPVAPAAANTQQAPNARNEVVSPDGRLAAYIQEYNLWVRNTQTNQKTQLTTDGVKDYGYATDNAGWSSSDQPVLRWSPDSRKIATFQQDQRRVGDMYLVTTNVGHPTLKAWKYPLPGDKDIITIERVIVEVHPAKVVRLQVPPDPHRGTLSDDISSSGTFDDVDWSADAKQLAFVSTSRNHKEEKFRIADAQTGAVREVFEEKVATQYESGQGAINWTYLPKNKEIIWYSERDDWGHLYLYDATTGKVKNQITKGNWVVTQLVKVDEQRRQLYFLADGREPGNPYFTHLYRIGLDGKGLTLLTPEKGNHRIEFSPSGRYFIDTYSQPDVPPVSVLRNLDGKTLVALEKTDISRLAATGWKAPTPITVKSHDGQFDLYGLVFTPTKLDPNRKYPVIDYIYPGPQGGSVGNWSFSAARGDNQALAELGFVVVVLEGSCNPLRSKSFHDACYGNMAENTLSDQIAGIKQLAQKYPYLDLDRVGIWGHSGGGYATAAALFRYPDFFKVGISESGNHENRNYEDDWGERYIGLLTTQDNGASNYDNQANATYAKNLKGKLMLAHGMMDNNVPPYNTMLVVEALTKANKSYDLVIFPNATHGFGQDSPYMTRRRWDYFVQYLAGATPPHDYQMQPKPDPRTARR
ncbi:S9 family peptidase [Hymenobacter aerilatus]|uniref:S9 family peptidase n=1 Tax=Hymenobacter aerilatus TaxID=2932251 RepID=A0A8T9SW16_9BACT|nr:S9 family peptidase [Hymenobacter aerilatus]UOR04913.1 S9 family peptidase [Hymenobacter aerilatus]